MARRAALRASDSDREHIAERLRKATAEGRLLAEELEDRLGVAFKARTYGELDALVADLPREAQRRSRRLTTSRVVAIAIALAMVLAVIGIIVLFLTGAAVVFLWGAAFWWMFAHRWGWHGRRRRMYRGWDPGGDRLCRRWDGRSERLYRRWDAGSERLYRA